MGRKIKPARPFANDAEALQAAAAAAKIEALRNYRD
jgi:hypothetical protein